MKYGSPTSSRPRRLTSTTSEEAECGGKGVLREDVGPDAALGDVVARRRQVAGDRQLECSARRQLVDLLDVATCRTSAPRGSSRGRGPLAHRRRPRTRSRSRVDEHRRAGPSRRRCRARRRSGGPVRAGERGDDRPAAQEERRDADRLVRSPPGLPRRSSTIRRRACPRSRRIADRVAAARAAREGRDVDHPDVPVEPGVHRVTRNCWRMQLHLERVLAASDAERSPWSPGRPRMRPTASW